MEALEHLRRHQSPFAVALLEFVDRAIATSSMVVAEGGRTRSSAGGVEWLDGIQVVHSVWAQALGHIQW